MRQQLRDSGLAVEVETRLGQGGRRTVLVVPTLAGLRAVGQPPRAGRGGALHRHFQEVVARHGRAQGYSAEVEHRLPAGGSVDVHLVQHDQRVAVEIAIHSRPDREVQNIQKCLDAGYDHVVVLFLDPALLQETRTRFVAAATAEARQQVQFRELTRLRDMLPA